MKLVEIMSSEEKLASKWLHKCIRSLTVNGYEAKDKLTFKDGYVAIKTLKSGPHSDKAELNYDAIELAYGDFNPPFDATVAFESFKELKLFEMKVKDPMVLPNIKTIILRHCRFDTFKGIDKLTNLEDLMIEDVNQAKTNTPCGLLSLYKFAQKHGYNSASSAKYVTYLDWGSFKVEGVPFEKQPIKIMKDSLNDGLSVLEFQDKLIDADLDEWAKL